MLELVKYYYKTLFAANLDVACYQHMFLGVERTQQSWCEEPWPSGRTGRCACWQQAGSCVPLALCWYWLICSWFSQGFPWAGGSSALRAEQTKHLQVLPAGRTHRTHGEGRAALPLFWRELEENWALTFKTEWNWYLKRRWTGIWNSPMLWCFVIFHFFAVILLLPWRRLHSQGFLCWTMVLAIIHQHMQARIKSFWLVRVTCRMSTPTNVLKQEQEKSLRWEPGTNTMFSSCQEECQVKLRLNHNDVGERC